MLKKDSAFILSLLNNVNLLESPQNVKDFIDNDC